MGFFDTGIRIKAVDRLSKVIDKVKNKIPKLTKEINKARNQFNRFQKSTLKLRQSLTKMGTKLKSVGAKMTIGLTAPIAAFGAFSLKSAGDFEAAMKDVQGKTTLTTVSMEQLAEKGKELGATTQFSANEAATAMGFLAQAGLDSQQIFDGIGPTLQLAAAASIELGEAADISTNVLMGYGMQVKDLTKLNNLMVKTINSSNTNIQELSESMKVAGPIFASQKQPIQETLAVIGQMANAGIKGSEAGVALRKSMSSLLKPTAEAKRTFAKLKIPSSEILNADGSVKSFTGTLKLLEKRGATATDLIRIFGERAGPKLIPLLKAGTAEIDKLANKVLSGNNGVGEAAKIAELKMQGFNGAIKEVKSAFEAFGIALADSGFLDFMGSLIRKVADAFRWLSKLSPTTLKIIGIFAAVVAVLGPLLAALGVFLTILPAMITGIGILSAVSLPISGTFLAIAAGIAAVVAIVGIILVKWRELVELFDSNPFLSLVKSAFLLLSPLGQIITAVKLIISLFQGMDALKQTLRDILPSFIADKIFGPQQEGGPPQPIAPSGAEVGATRAIQNTITNEQFKTQTNNARVDVFVKAPEGTKVIGQGENGSMNLFDLGMGGAF